MASFGLIGLASGIGGQMVKDADRENEMAGKRDFETWRLEVLDQYQQKSESRAEARTIDSEKRGLVNRATERAAITDETVANAPRLRQVKVDDAKATKLSEFDPEVTDARLSAEEKSARQKAKVEREETIATGRDPAYLAAKRKLAQAGHIEGLGSVAQAKLANLKLEELQQVNSLIKEFETTTDEARKAKIKEALTVRGIIKPTESDIEKVVESEYDDMGNQVKKVERTQKRGVGAPKPDAGGRKVGETVTVQAGPNKGKTAVWDGQGWKLK